jgi:hypothetical protein
MKVVSSLPLRTGRLYARNILVLIFRGWTCRKLRKKIPSDTTEDRSRDLPTSSALTTTLPQAPNYIYVCVCVCVSHITSVNVAFMKRFWQLMYQLCILPSKEHLIPHLSYTKPLGLTNNPTRFGARRRHIQGVPSQLLVSHHVKWYPTTVRTCFAEIQHSFAIHESSWCSHRWMVINITSNPYHLKYTLF